MPRGRAEHAIEILVSTPFKAIKNTVEIGLKVYWCVQTSGKLTLYCVIPIPFVTMINVGLFHLLMTMQYEDRAADSYSDAFEACRTPRPTVDRNL